MSSKNSLWAPTIQGANYLAHRAVEQIIQGGGREEHHFHQAKEQVAKGSVGRRCYKVTFVRACCRLEAGDMVVVQVAMLSLRLCYTVASRCCHSA